MLCLEVIVQMQNFFFPVRSAAKLSFLSSSMWRRVLQSVNKNVSGRIPLLLV
jgi:hypothetical protein